MPHINLFEEHTKGYGSFQITTLCLAKIVFNFDLSDWVRIDYFTKMTEMGLERVEEIW